MRTVILYNSSWYVFLLRQNLIKSLQVAGHAVTVVAPVDGYTERVQQLGVDFISVDINGSGRSPLQEARTLAGVYHAIKASGAETVLSFTVKCNLYAGLCRRLLDFKHVANVSGLGQLFDMGTGVHRAAHLLYRLALARTEVVFFQNAEDQARLRASGAVAQEQSRVIPGSGVDLSRFAPAQRVRRSQRSFLMLGRLLPKKGFDHLIEAADELRRRYADKVTFWVLGAVDHSRVESTELAERINQAHARGVIRYLHSTDDALPFIREADVVVLPSTYNEGVPRSLLEALACGKPVVTTDWKGCRDTVQNGENGFLVRPHDTTSLIEALDLLATCEPELLERFGTHSRRLAEQRFDERIVLDAYLECVSRAS